VRSADRVEVEALAHPRATGFAEASSQRGVVEQPADGGREQVWVSRRDEQAGLTVDHQLRNAAHAGRDDGQAGRHRLEDGERQALGATGQHEDVRPGEQRPDVPPVAEHPDARAKPEALELELDCAAERPIAHEVGLEGRLEAAERTDERQRVLGGLQPADPDDPGRIVGTLGGSGRSEIDAVWDHDGRVRIADPGRDARTFLALGHADGDGREGTDRPLGPAVGRGGDAVVREEGPAVDGVDPDRHAGDCGRQAGKHARFRAVGVHDVRSQTTHQRDELEQAERVPPETERPPHVTELDERNSGRPGGVGDGSGPMRGDRGVEGLGDGRQQRRHVRLGATGLGERDDEQEASSTGLHGHLSSPPLARLLIAATVVALFLLWAGDEGGYSPSAWYPGGLVIIAGLAAVVLSGSRPTRAAAVALVLFSLFAGWCLLSIAWAGVRGDAWDGANRTLLYFAVYAVFALPRWRAAEAAVVVGALTVGTAAMGLGSVLAGGESVYIDGRLAEPIGYANAVAALHLIAFWPALALASSSQAHWAARALLLGAAGVSLELAVLAQSRATLLAGTAALVVYLIASRERGRAIAFLLAVAGVLLAALPRLLDVFAASSSEAGRAADAAADALVVSALALILLGAVAAWLESRRLRPVRRPRARVIVLVTIVVLAIVAVAGVGSSLGSTRLASGLETGRYDLWRVALDEVRSRPLLGAGVDNFAVDFIRLRSYGEEPLYPHSLVLRPFSQAGLVGGVLFLVVVGATLGAAARARRQGPVAAAVVAGTLAAAAYWLVHGSLDWLWEIPAVTAPVFALLGLAAGLASRPLRPPLCRPAVIVAVVAAAVSFALPGLAALEVERAVEAFPRDADESFERLDRARAINPLSERPDVVSASLALRAGHPARARSALLRALDRNPNDWRVHVQLAALDGARGDRGSAAARIARARELNPRGRTVALAERTLAAGEGWAALAERLEDLAVRSPLGRRSVACRPVTGIAGRCTAEEGAR
jgi:O-antigen ligase